MGKISIKDWAHDDQPRKKLLQKGPASLSNSELLAILINHGTPGQSALDIAQELLRGSGDDLKKLADRSVKEMTRQKIKGFGETKAVTIAAALELGIRRGASMHQKTQVTKSDDIANYLRATLEYRKKEVFAVVFLNNGNKITHLEIISEGGMTATVADPRIILKKALEHEATAMILCHNHPGGNLRPSRQDEAITQKIKQAAAYLDISIMDHIIVSNEGYFSFADAGLI